MAEVQAGAAGDDEDLRRGAAILAGLRQSSGKAAGPRIGGYPIPPESKIGEGRFCEVFRSRDPNLRRDVAIKLLREGYQANEVQLARMENEAMALSKLQGTEVGKHVVQIFGSSRATATSGRTWCSSWSSTAPSRSG